MRHQWNTGRLYQKDGQKIIAEVRQVPRIADRAEIDHEVHFKDISRGISGKFPLVRNHGVDKYSLEQLVMTAYDFGQFENTLWSDVQDLQWVEK